MRIFYSSKFAREYSRLPAGVKQLAEKKIAVFRENPFTPALKTHRLKGGLSDFFSFSLNQKYRIIFELKDKQTAWFLSVGDHSIYQLWD